MVSAAVVIGGVLVIGGALLSLTGIGAIVGLPMILFGIITWFVWGMWALSVAIFGGDDDDE